jgi:glycosyltransferase involved in cell wall biosynthesis
MACNLAHISQGIKIAHRPDDADFILYIDNGYHGLSSVKRYFNVLKSFSYQKIIVYSETDWPLPWAPGAYPSLSDQVKEQEPFFSWCYISASHRNLQTRSLPNIKPHYLFSFLGRQSTHKIRQEISTKLHSQSTPCLDIHDASKYFKDFSYQSTYHRLIQDSKFVLCPRGFGRGSIRVFEAMSLGRAPVIISDGWKEPPDIDFSSCSIRIQEKDIARIPQILTTYEHKAQEFGQKARELFEYYFAPEVFLERLIQKAWQQSEKIHPEALLKDSLLRYGLKPWHLKTWFSEHIRGRRNQ